MLRKKVILFSFVMSVILTSVFPTGLIWAEEKEGELLKNNGFEEIKEGKPVHWSFVTYGEKSEIFMDKTDDRGYAGCIKTTELNGMGNINQTIDGLSLPEGTTFKLSGYYRTEDFIFGKSPDCSFAVYYNFRNEDKAFKRYQKIGLTPSKEWKYVESFETIDLPISSLRVFLLDMQCKGKIWVDRLSLEAVKKKATINAKEKYIWREAEDLVQPGAGIHGGIPKSELDNKNYFSGGGAAICASDVNFTWQFRIKEETDEKTLFAKEYQYYMWLRNYGYRQQPQVAVVLDDKKVFEFQTKRTEEVDANNNYVGGGTYYWQPAGAFSSKGGRHKLELRTKGPFCLDAILVTTDQYYKPDIFEAREVASKDYFVDAKGNHIINSIFKVNGISDKIASPVFFQIFPANNSPVSIGGNDKAIFHLMLPGEVILKNVSSHWAGTTWNYKSHSHKELSYKKTMEKKIDGKLMNFYEIDLYYLWAEYIIYVQADKDGFKPDKNITGEYWLEYKDSKQTPEKLLIKTVDIKPATAFSKIFIGPSGGYHPSMTSDYPDMVETMKYAGINFYNPWWVEPECPEVYPNHLWTDFMKECRENKIIIATMYTPLGGGNGPKSDTPDDWAVDITGKKTEQPSLSIDLKGEVFQKNLENIRKIGSSGMGMTMDDEFYNKQKDTIDYSERCKKEFRKYLEENTSFFYKDPVKIVKNKEEEKELYDAWVDFKCSRITERYKLYREAYEQGCQEAKSASTVKQEKQYFIPIILKDASPQETKENTYWDYKLLSKYCTHVSPMIYPKEIKRAGEVGDYIKMYTDYVGESVIAPTILTGYQGYGEISLSEKPVIKYQIFEGLMHKAPGIILYASYAAFDPLNLSPVTEAIRLTQPYEDFFIDGEIYNEIKAEPVDWVRVRALKYNDKILLYVANYQNNPEKKVSVILKEKPGSVIELATGEAVTMDGKKFYLDFQSDRGKLFLIK
ncbi:MAG: hypothetical protein ABIJ11_07490 [Elusimicrobiota bacterium]